MNATYIPSAENEADPEELIAAAQKHPEISHYLEQVDQHGLNYGPALELMVIALAKKVDELQEQIDKLSRVH